MKTNKLIFSAVAVSCLLTVVHARDWTNTDGKTITAELVSATDDTVVLKMENGREYTVALNTLSTADNEFANNWQAEQAAIAEAPMPKAETLMTTPGKLLFSTNFSEIGSDWRQAHGDWTGGEEGLSGAERAADEHAAVMKMAMPLKDVIIQYDVMLGETKSAMFGIDDSKDHMCRVTFTKNSFQARKDDNDHEGPDAAKPFNTVNEDFAADEWHTVTIELLGEEMVAHTDDIVSLGSDPLLATEKAKWGFVVSGPTAKFRDLKIWEALPNEEWEKTGSRLKRKLDIDE